jgi:hypothetical protein
MPLLPVFQSYVEHQVPRILTQLDRDPDSPTFGCFDRNYWHYKIRDFPSSILQQGAFTVEAIRTGQVASLVPTALCDRWAIAAVNALARQVDRQGRVDEYYPFEAGYPPAAFGLYAAGRLLLDWETHAPQLAAQVYREPLRRLAQNLADRLEAGATNQQAAGLAGLALTAKAGLVTNLADRIQALATQLFQAQHPEGWFNEYGGPDFGYLTVTLDALIDYYDATQDERAIAAIDRAIHFLAQMVGGDGRLPSTLNSRNTDYVVPYGLVRAAHWNSTATWLVETLFRDLHKPHHFCWSTDDRYHCHYLFASIVRSLPHLSGMQPAQSPTWEESLWLTGCGYAVYRPTDQPWTAYIGARKGGLVRIHRHQSAGQSPVLEYGWRITQGQKGWTSNWWSADWRITYTENTLHLSGNCPQTSFHVPTPIKHGILRLLAFGLRQRLIPLLKRAMIFRPGSSTGPSFERTVEWGPWGVTLDDHLGAWPGGTAIASPRQNLRHVASADSFSREEFLPSLLPSESFTLDQGQVIKTKWDASAAEPAGNREGHHLES